MCWRIWCACLFVVLAVSADIDADTLQNAAHTNYAMWYLDIDRNNGAVILSRDCHKGCNWKIVTHAGKGMTLQNLGDGPYNGHYLDIDGKTGNAILSRELFNGCLWDVHTTDDGKASLRNLGRSQYRGCFLDINRETGQLVLSKQAFPGIWWKRTATPDQPANLGIDVDGKRWSYPIVVAGGDAQKKAREIAQKMNGRLPTASEFRSASPRLKQHPAFNKPLHVYFTNEDGIQWHVPSNTEHKDSGAYNGFDLITVVTP